MKIHSISLWCFSFTNHSFGHRTTITIQIINIIDIINKNKFFLHLSFRYLVYCSRKIAIPKTNNKKIFKILNIPYTPY
jgi:hypothetical protein